MTQTRWGGEGKDFATEFIFKGWLIDDLNESERDESQLSVERSTQVYDIISDKMNSADLGPNSSKEFTGRQDASSSWQKWTFIEVEGSSDSVIILQ